jgi:hypothetical protein
MALLARAITAWGIRQNAEGNGYEAAGQLCQPDI